MLSRNESCPRQPNTSTSNWNECEQDEPQAAKFDSAFVPPVSFMTPEKDGAFAAL